MRYHHLIQAPGLIAAPRSRDHELLRSVNEGQLPTAPVPDYDFNPKRRPYPAYPFSFGAGLMSLELQEILVSGLGPKDRVEWVPCTVFDDEIAVPYAIPIIKPTVELDPLQSTFGPGGRPIRWVLRAESLKGRNVIKVPGVRLGLVLSDDIREEIERRQLSGLDWLPARVA